MTDKEDLLRQIAMSFPVLPTPSAGEIVEDVPCDSERAEIREDLALRSWDSLSLETLQYHAEALFFLTRKAWLYFIPAYVSAALNHYEESDMVPTMIVASLFDFHDELSSSMSTAQRSALRNFLRWLRTAHPDHPKLETIDRLIELLGDRRTGHSQ